MTLLLEMFSCIAQMDKKSKTHTRIIWACSWSHDDYYFATGSRDKKVIKIRRRLYFLHFLGMCLE